MNISITSSEYNGDSFNNNVIVQEEKIRINAQDFQISENGAKLVLNVSTATDPPLENEYSLEIEFINKSPVIEYSGNTTILLTDNSTDTDNNFNLNITVTDEELDKIMFSAQLSSDINVTLPTAEVSQSGNQF